jgi:hypothetical protein
VDGQDKPDRHETRGAEVTAGHEYRRTWNTGDEPRQHDSASNATPERVRRSSFAHATFAGAG